MILTGKCKEDFEKWCYTENANESLELMCLRNLYSLTESMQYGVYVDFFDSVGIYILNKRFGNFKIFNLWYFSIQDSEAVHISNYRENTFDSRPETRIKAIEKANEIYNKL